MLASVVEVEVEVQKKTFRVGMFEMLDDRRAENRLSTPRDAMKPQEGMLFGLPLLENIALQEPQSCVFLTLLACFVVVR